MNNKFRFLAIIFLATTASCSLSTAKFSMPVSEVEELHGFVLKGISITGTISKGCIANDNEFVVTRSGKVVLTNTVRLVEVVDLKNPDSFNGEAYFGEQVRFYIPDLKKTDVQPGDIISSETANCPKGPTRK